MYLIACLGASICARIVPHLHFINTSTSHVRIHITSHILLNSFKAIHFSYLRELIYIYIILIITYSKILSTPSKENSPSDWNLLYPCQCLHIIIHQYYMTSMTLASNSTKCNLMLMVQYIQIISTQVQ